MARARTSKKRPADLAAQLQQLDALMAGQQWPEAEAQALALWDAAPTTPGLLERAVMVLRERHAWPALAELMLKARNSYGLWAQGSELLLGQAWLEQGQYQQAQTMLEEALADDPSSGWAHHFLGKALRGLGEREQALLHQRDAAEALPEFAWACFEAAELLVELDRPLEAALELQEAQRRSGGEDHAELEQLHRKLQPALAALQVDALLAAGDRDGASAAVWQAMLQHASEPLLLERARNLVAAEQAGLTSDTLAAVEQELQSFELLLDALEADLQRQGF